MPVVLSTVFVFGSERIDHRLTPEQQQNAREGKRRRWMRRVAVAGGLGLFWRLVVEAAPVVIQALIRLLVPGASE